MLQRIILTTALFSAFSMSHAELADLTESELSDVSAEGIALVFEDFQIEMKGEVMGGEVGNDFKITGIKDQLGNDVNVAIGQYYLSGTGSNLGTTLDGKLVNLGRLNNSITIDVLDGNSLSAGTGSWANKSVLAIAMPTQVAAANGYDCTAASSNVGSGTCSSRPDNADGNGFHGERFDMGYRINRQFANSTKDVNLNFHAQSANMDGSYLRLWGSDDSDINDHAMKMEIQMNFYASKLVFNSCELDGSTACGEQVGFENFSMELALGDAKFYQPMTIDVTDAGFLHIMIQRLPKPGDSRIPSGSISSTTGLTPLGGFDPSTGGKPSGGDADAELWNWYDDYYTNGRKTNISISNLTVGSESFGSSSLQGLQIQYLEVTSHDI